MRHVVGPLASSTHEAPSSTYYMLGGLQVTLTLKSGRVQIYWRGYASLLSAVFLVSISVGVVVKTLVNNTFWSIIHDMVNEI